MRGGRGWFTRSENHCGHESHGAEVPSRPAQVALTAFGTQGQTDVPPHPSLPTHAHSSVRSPPSCRAAAPLAVAAQRAATVPLLPEPTVAALAGELSGASAKRNLEFITRQHRMRASKGFRSAADFVAAQAKLYGLEEVTVHEFPADGHTMYGTQKARLGVGSGVRRALGDAREGGRVAPVLRLASFEDTPVILAEDSDSADVTDELVDVGAGTSDKDYAGKDVRGKLVLTSEAPGGVVPLAIDKFGAKGVMSAAQNQPNAWSREDVNAIRWGHLDSFETRHTFAFMVSLKQYRALQERLASGEHITLHAIVRASRHAATYNPGDRAHPRQRPEGRGDRAQLPPRPPAPGRERQRERLRHDPRGRAHAVEADRRRKDRASSRAAFASCGRARSSARSRSFIRSPRCARASRR